MSELSVSIPINQITITEDYLIRFDHVDESGVNSHYVIELQKSDPSTWPPIAVIPNGGDGYLLVDGYHRLVAARTMKLKSINAIILKQANFETAFELNQNHGLRLTVNDRKEHALRLHDKYPTLSEREIARRTGLDHVTVGRALRKGGEIHQPGKSHLDDVVPLSIARARAARNLLNLVSKLSITRGLLSSFNDERAAQELAASLREQVKLNPDFQHSLKLLKSIVDLATSPNFAKDKKH